MYQKVLLKKKKIKAAQFFIPLEKPEGEKPTTRTYTCIVGRGTQIFY